MSAPRPHLQDVILVDLEPDAAPDAAASDALRGAGAPRGAGSGAQESAARARRRLRRCWPVAAGLVLALTTVAVVADHRASVRLAALAAVPGMLTPLDGPVRELWRSEEGQFSDLAQVAGRLVGVEHRLDGAVDVVALDPSSGAVAWRVAAQPSGARDTLGECVWPDAPAAPGSRVLADCLLLTGTALFASAAGASPDVVEDASAARLLVLDAAEGTVVSDDPVDPSTSIAALGTDVITCTVDADRHARVVRTDATGAVERWTFTSPAPVPLDRFGHADARVAVVDGLVVVSGVRGWVLSADGAVLRSWNSDPTRWDGGRVAVINQGQLLVERGTTAASGGGSTIVDVATRSSFTEDGYAIGPVPNDGSLGNLVLTQPATGTDLVAFEGSSGARRWTSTDGVGGDLALGALLVIDGRVVRAEGDRLRAIDGRTGATIWATPVPRPSLSSLFSDGQVVLRVQANPSEGLVLVAYSLDDGSLAWRTHLPDDSTLTVVAGRLYGSSAQGIVALGRD